MRSPWIRWSIQPWRQRSDTPMEHSLSLLSRMLGPPASEGGAPEFLSPPAQGHNSTHSLRCISTKETHFVPYCAQNGCGIAGVLQEA